MDGQSTEYRVGIAGMCLLIVFILEVDPDGWWNVAAGLSVAAAIYVVGRIGGMPPLSSWRWIFAEKERLGRWPTDSEIRARTILFTDVAALRPSDDPGDQVREIAPRAPVNWVRIYLSLGALAVLFGSAFIGARLNEPESVWAQTVGLVASISLMVAAHRSHTRRPSSEAPQQTRTD